MILSLTSGTPPKSNDGRLFRAAGREIRRHPKRQRDEEDAPSTAVRLGHPDTVAFVQHPNEQHVTADGHAPGQLYSSDAAPLPVRSHNDHANANAESSAAAESLPGHLSRRHVPAVPPPSPCGHAGNATDTFR